MRSSIVNCVSEALDMLAFSSKQMIERSGLWSFDYVIVCWNTTPEVDEFIERLTRDYKKRCRVHRVDHVLDRSIGYVPNLRKMINEGIERGLELNDYVGLINTDQAFGKSWLSELSRFADRDRIVFSSVIEMVKDTMHYHCDLGPTVEGKFRLKEFDQLVLQLRGDLLLSMEDCGGFQKVLGLPYLFHRDVWERCGPWALTLIEGVPDLLFFDKALREGFTLQKSRSSWTYHMGGAERGALNRDCVPDFAKSMSYE